jgi:hypothetical protein
MPAPMPEPGLDEEQSPGGAQRRGGQGWAWVEGGAYTGPMPECGPPGPQPEPPTADGLPPGLDYAALVEGLAASGALGSDAEDQDAEFAEWLAAEAEGRLEPADPAAVAAVAVEHMAPGPAQAGWLEVAAGGVGRLDENALTGVTLAACKQQARAAATELSAVARLCAQTAVADPKIGLRSDGRPARISRDALGQIEMALRLSHYGAQALADLAVTLTWRLPATLAALGSGRIDLYRAQLIVGATSVLSQELARHVEKQILPGAGQDTAAQLRQRLAYAVIAADPEAAEERRQDAERRAEMRLYADDDQTATLLLTKLPQVEAAASFARVTALARARMAAGIPGTLNFHRAQVALGLLNGTLPPIPPAEGAPPDQPPPDSDPRPGDNPWPAKCDGSSGAARGEGRPAECDGSSGAARGEGRPAECDGSSDAARGEGRPAECDGSSDAAPGAGQPADGSWQDELPAPRDEDAPPDDGLQDLSGDPEPSWDPVEDDDDLFKTGPVPAWPALGEIPPGLARRDPAHPQDGRAVPGLLDVLLPWTTLAGQSDRPGMLGWVGPITAAQARQLARTAEGDRAAQWRVIVTNNLGQALAVARIRRPRRGDGPAHGDPAAPAGVPSAAGGLVGRITVTITQDTITTMGQRADDPRAGPGPPPAAVAVLRAAARALDRALECADADAAVGGCAHADESPRYRPPPRLREYVIARDVTCRNPSCRQPASRADLDHTRPFDQSGRTCRCNLGGRCRRDHILKQHPRWGFRQEGGDFTWTAPSGRSYTTGPDTYPI